MLNHITVNEVRRMGGTEGLVLQGCGGDPQEWIDGVNQLLTNQGILLDGDTFREISRFEHDGHTNLLFHMDGVKLDGGKLAMWRLQTLAQFRGTWLSDYLPNRLGVTPEQEPDMDKPECPLIGADGNVFNLLGITARTLKDCGLDAEAKEMRSRVMESGSYDKALAIMTEYVTPVEADGQEQNGCDYPQM